MTIKRANMEDVPHLIQVMKGIYKNLGENELRLYAGGRVNWRALESHFYQSIPKGFDFVVFYSDYSVLVASIQNCWYNPTYRVCSENFWMSGQPDQGGALIKKLIEWAEDSMATHILLSSQHEGDRIDTFMSKVGFEKFATHWSMTLV